MTTLDRIIIYTVLFVLILFSLLDDAREKFDKKAIKDHTQSQLDDLRTYYKLRQDYLQARLDSVHILLQGQDSILKNLQLEKKSLILKMR